MLELVEGGDLLDHIMKTSGLCDPSFSILILHVLIQPLAEIDARDITYQMCNALAVRLTSLMRITPALTSICSISTPEE